MFAVHGVSAAGKPAQVHQWASGRAAQADRRPAAVHARRGRIVCDGKSGKHRVTVLPDNLMPSLQKRLSPTKALHDDVGSPLDGI